MNFSYEGKTLIVNGQSIELSYAVKQALLHNDVVIVRVDDFEAPASDPFNGRNVFALDRKGKEIWRIALNGGEDTTVDGRKIILSWGYIWREPGNDTIRASDGRGYAYKIDLRTGEVSDPVFRK